MAGSERITKLNGDGGNRNRRVAYLGVMLSLALILSYIESLVPFFFGVPGMKLGLTNVIVVLLLLRGSRGDAKRAAFDAFLISMLRILLAGILFGNPFSVLYSFAGGILSFAGMLVALYKLKLHSVTVSVLGGVLHNVGQLFVAWLVVANFAVWGYATVLFASGFLTGGLIGVMAVETDRRLPKGAGYR